MIVRCCGVFLVCVGTISVYAQVFETEIAPLLRRECIDCHGPALQMSGLRLDRREDALQVIESGSSEDSLLILRLVDKDLGVLMPPKFGDGSGLAEKDIVVLRAWIDAGAKWPDKVNLAEQSPQSKETIRVAAFRSFIRNGEFRKVEELLEADPNQLRIPNDHGSTALHAACLYGDAQLVSTLIDWGANVNASDNEGVTPLMLAVNDIEKVRVLLKAGADKYAVSKLEKTPLEIAATYSGNIEVVRLLLFPPTQKSKTQLAVNRALENAARVLDIEMVKELVANGGTVKNPDLFFFTRSGSPDLVKQLLQSVGSDQMQLMLDAALAAAAVEGSSDNLRMLLDRGANPTQALAVAAYSEYANPSKVKLLLDAGADPNKPTRIMRGNELPLDMAKRHGHPEVVDLLIQAVGK